MLRIHDRPLPLAAADRLRVYQQEVDRLSGYAKRVAAAKRIFGARNRRDNAAFRAVRENLIAMSGGVRRCMYCEDSTADEVEHFQPKDLYPELVFNWPNFLHACGPCNVVKSSRFFVFHSQDRRILDVTRRRGDPVAPPPAGRPVLINPRADDPLDFLTLDLRETFRFLPRAAEGSPVYARARRTIEVLKLNQRGLLPKARQAAYHAFLGALWHYTHVRDQGGDAGRLLRIRKAISRMPHPTVWSEMKRQEQHIPELSQCFGRVPEALDW